MKAIIEIHGQINSYNKFRRAKERKITKRRTDSETEQGQENESEYYFHR